MVPHTATRTDSCFAMAADGGGGTGMSFTAVSLRLMAIEGKGQRACSTVM